MFSYIGLVIFAHAAHARVGKENFQYSFDILNLGPERSLITQGALTHYP